ncbi:long-chain fatty acid--CoA ligase [Azospirillum sp. 412522]|nr:AMP-binding protein [Azospirillum sp. 412522]MBY6265785.1 long-chain fatty acid--CoA ligase [Azospirillum sp. 412522]
MTGRRPDWIHPAFRLIEGEEVFGWEDLAALCVPRGGILRADRPSRVLAALAAAEAAGQGLLLARSGLDGAQDGRAGAEGWQPGQGFAVTLESSGTTGTPKRLRHDFARLRGRLRGVAGEEARWLLTYDPGTFAGLQVMLTAAAAGALLVAVPDGGTVAALAQAARRHAVTHVSGTPSFWRAFLMALGAAELPLAAVTLGGEAADQPLLDRLDERFPHARLRHIYASTEAGALFAVADGRAGFPAVWLDEAPDGLALRIADGVLEVRSPRAAPGAVDADGWLSTGDLVERLGDRVLFAGRLDGLVNVGGVKVSPEAVERRLLAVDGVADAAVVAVPSPITGHLLTATIVPDPGAEEAPLRAALRSATVDLPPAARPRALTFADHLPLTAAGKKSRKGAA